MMDQGATWSEQLTQLDAPEGFNANPVGNAGDDLRAINVWDCVLYDRFHPLHILRKSGRNPYRCGVTLLIEIPSRFEMSFLRLICLGTATVAPINLWRAHCLRSAEF